MTDIDKQRIAALDEKDYSWSCAFPGNPGYRIIGHAQMISPSTTVALRRDLAMLRARRTHLDAAIAQIEELLEPDGKVPGGKG